MPYVPPQKNVDRQKRMQKPLPRLNLMRNGITEEEVQWSQEKIWEILAQKKKKKLLWKEKAIKNSGTDENVKIGESSDLAENKEDADHEQEVDVDVKVPYKKFQVGNCDDPEIPKRLRFTKEERRQFERERREANQNLVNQTVSTKDTVHTENPDSS